MSESTSWPQPPDELPPALEWTPPDATVTGGPLRHRFSRRALGFTAIAAVLIAGAAVAAWIAYVNKDRADRWQARAVVLQGNVDALNGLVVRRTALLNARAAQLNTLAAKVEQSQSALSQSESDVQSLEQRQRQLANEKSQLEDERASLQQVAANFITCKDDLQNAIQALAAQDYAWIDANGAIVQNECDTADSSLQGFVSAYPNG